MPDPLHIADPDDPEGFSLASFIARLGVVPGPPATFFPDERDDLAEAWRLWVESCFAPHLAPAYLDACLAAAEYRLAEIETIDRRLDSPLDGPLGARSRAAAAPFLEGKVKMRAHREWRRFTEAAADGATPGHVAIVHALQSTLYRVPPASALAAYAWFEFQSGTGRGTTGGTDPAADPAFTAVLPHVSVAVGRINGDSGDASGALRAI